MSCCRLWPTVHFAIFLTALTAWTVALLSPVPQESAEKVLGSQFGIFVFAKTVHVTAYAILAVLGGSAVLLGRNWVWIIPTLVLHGAVTEYFQQFVGRGSRIGDVALDAVGVGLGALVVWSARRFKQPRGEAAQSTPE